MSWNQDLWLWLNPDKYIRFSVCIIYQIPAGPLSFGVLTLGLLLGQRLSKPFLTECLNLFSALSMYHCVTWCIHRFGGQLRKRVKVEEEVIGVIRMSEKERGNIILERETEPFWSSSFWMSKQLIRRLAWNPKKYEDLRSSQGLFLS